MKSLLQIITFTNVSDLINLLLQSLLQILEDDPKFEDVDVRWIYAVPLQVKEDVPVLCHVCVDERLCRVLGVVKKSTPLIENAHKVILNRVKTAMMPMLHDTTLAQVMSTLRTVEETVHLGVALYYLVVRAQVHQIARLAVQHHRRRLPQLRPQVVAHSVGHRCPREVVVLNYGALGSLINLYGVLLRRLRVLERRLFPRMVQRRDQLLLIHHHEVVRLLVHTVLYRLLAVVLELLRGLRLFSRRHYYLL